LHGRLLVVGAGAADAFVLPLFSALLASVVGVGAAAAG
jgi:hypothetical protein